MTKINCHGSLHPIIPLLLFHFGAFSPIADLALSTLKVNVYSSFEAHFFFFMQRISKNLFDSSLLQASTQSFLMNQYLC